MDVLMSQCPDACLLFMRIAVVSIETSSRPSLFQPNGWMQTKQGLAPFLPPTIMLLI